MLKVMSLRIIREIAANLHRTQSYTIMADETSDASDKEQIVLCFRWVSDDLTVHEDFIGFYQTDTIEANPLVNYKGCFIGTKLINFESQRSVL